MLKSAIYAASMIALGAPASMAAAANWSLWPANTAFTLAGDMLLTTPAGSATCAVVGAGSTDAIGAATILRWTVSGPGRCGALTLGAPMSFWAIKRGRIETSSVTLTLGDGAVCGPTALRQGAWDANGRFVFASEFYPGHCVLTGHMSTSPRIDIVKAD